MKWNGGQNGCEARPAISRGRTTGPLKRTLRVCAAILALVMMTGCGKPKEDPFDFRMVVQPKYNTMDASNFFADGRSARPLVAGTIPVDGYPNEVPIQAVSSVRSTATNFPFPLSRRDIERGRQVYMIYCTVCHGALGDGNGMIPQRGFIHPPSFYLQRLRDAAPGHFYDVITNGYGAMFSYNDRISPDRKSVV